MEEHPRWAHAIRYGRHSSAVPREDRNLPPSDIRSDRHVEGCKGPSRSASCRGLKTVGRQLWYPTSREKRARYPDFLYVALSDGRACGFHRGKPHETYERHKLHRKSGIWGTRDSRSGQNSEGGVLTHTLPSWVVFSRPLRDCSGLPGPTQVSSWASFSRSLRQAQGRLFGTISLQALRPSRSAQPRLKPLKPVSCRKVSQVNFGLLSK